MENISNNEHVKPAIKTLNNKLPLTPSLPDKGVDLMTCLYISTKKNMADTLNSKSDAHVVML